MRLNLILVSTGALMPRSSLALAAAVIAVASTLAGCGADSGKPAAATGPMRVVAGFYPVEEAAAAIGGARVDVTNLTPPGHAAHDLELRPPQLAALEEASLVLFLGD